MAFDPYQNSAIKRGDTDARKLSMEQVKALANWCDWQRCSLTDNLTLAGCLRLFHDSIEYDSFEGWMEEDPKPAERAYLRVVRLHTAPQASA